MKRFLKRDTVSSDKTMDSKDHNEETGQGLNGSKSKLFHHHRHTHTLIDCQSQELNIKKEDTSKIEENNQVTQEKSFGQIKPTEAAATWNLLFPEENPDVGGSVKVDFSLKSREMDFQSE